MEIITIVFFSLVIILGIIMFSMKITSDRIFVHILLFVAIRLGSLYILAGAIWQLGKILGIFL